MDIAQHIRIFDKQPSDDLVEKRSAAVSAIASAYAERATVADILQLASDLTKGMAQGDALPNARATEVESIIRAKSTAFVKEGEELQILTCAYLAVLQMLSKATPTSDYWSRNDVLAMGLWCGLSLQQPRPEERLESLRAEVLNAARELVKRSGVKARLRKEVSDVAFKAPDAYEAAKLNETVKTAISHAIDALRTNAALDREELDLLWWVQGDWSAYGKKSFSAMNAIAATICAALEVGTLLRRIPSDAHKHLIVRHVKKEQNINLKKILDNLESEGVEVVTQFGNNELLKSNGAIFPLIHACVTSSADENGVNCILPLSDWAAHALLESSLLHVAELPRSLI